MLAVPKGGTPWSANIIFRGIVTMNKGYMYSEALR